MPIPIRSPVATSRRAIARASRGFTSRTASARTIVVADCAPVLPPMPISNGMNSARLTTSASVSSKAPSTLTVSVAATASTDSQTMRDRTSRRIGTDM